ncbi:MAG TPA: hypothetical protein VGB15_09095 [Longimicrobium sp.]
MAALIAAATLASPAAAQTDTAKVAPVGTAAPAATAPATATAEAPRPRRNRNEITRADMVEKNATNVYDGIRMIRASWLRASRSMSSSTQQNPVVAVYRDGSLAGGTGVLRDMSVESISKVEYFEPHEAVQRFGTQASGGAILVTTGSGH